MKHNTLTKIITLALAAVLALSLAACGSKTNDDSGDKTDAPVIKIGVPNDTTNEARALLLLQEQRHHQAEGRRGHHRHQERHRGKSPQRGDRGG